MIDTFILIMIVALFVMLKFKKPARIDNKCFYDCNGLPLSGGKLTFYDGVTLVTVMLDDNGKPSEVLPLYLYELYVYDKKDTIVMALSRINNND